MEIPDLRLRYCLYVYTCTCIGIFVQITVLVPSSRRVGNVGKKKKKERRGKGGRFGRAKVIAKCDLCARMIG